MLRLLIVTGLVAFAAAQGNCNNDADRSIVFAPNWEGQLSSCATGCFGAGVCTRDCIHDRTNVSVPCAQCFGDVTQCGTDNCFLPCLLNPNSSGCRDCVSQRCEPQLLVCSGLEEVPRFKPVSAIDYVSQDDLAKIKYGN